VIFNEEMVGREGLKRDQIVKIARFTGCKNFVGKRKKFIFNAFIDLKPVYARQAMWMALCVGI